MPAPRSRGNRASNPNSAAGPNARGLNPMMQRFVDELLVPGTTLKDAALRAGYSPKTAREHGARLAKDPRVKAAIDKGRARLADKLEITAEYVLRGLKTVAERCMQVAPVLDRKGKQVLVETPDGEMVPAFTFDSAGANKALELLGKHKKLFTETHEHSGPNGAPISIATIDTTDPIEAAKIYQRLIRGE